MYYSRYLSKESWLEMDNKGKFTITNEEGKELECEVLFTFDSDEFKKNYMKTVTSKFTQTPMTLKAKILI